MIVSLLSRIWSANLVSTIVYAVWYEIGEGESDTDNFFPEEVLLDWYENNRLEEETEKRGYNAEVVQSETTVLGAADFAG